MLTRGRIVASQWREAWSGKVRQKHLEKEGEGLMLWPIEQRVQNTRYFMRFNATQTGLSILSQRYYVILKFQTVLTSSIFIAFERVPPDISQSHSIRQTWHDEVKFAWPVPTKLIFIIFAHSSRCGWQGPSSYWQITQGNCLWRYFLRHFGLHLENLTKLDVWDEFIHSSHSELVTRIRN